MKLKLFTIGLLATIAMTSTTIEAAQRQRAQVQAAQEVPVLKQQVTDQHHVIASHEELTKALMDPANTIANGTPLDLALRAASGDAACAAHNVITAMPGGTAAEKVTALKTVEASVNAADTPHKIAIRKALGLKSDAGALLGGSPETNGVRRFGIIAEAELVDHPGIAAALQGIHGADVHAKLVTVLGRLNAATRSARKATPFGGGAAAANIDAALTRAGL